VPGILRVNVKLPFLFSSGETGAIPLLWMDCNQIYPPIEPCARRDSGRTRATAWPSPSPYRATESSQRNVTT